MSANDSFILEIEWEDAPQLPNLVGPFKTRKEADEWAKLKISNGSWTVAPLAYPYLRKSS